VWSRQTAGGDWRSQRIDCHRKVILAAIDRQADITLVALAEMLRAKHGASFAASTIWRFLDRHAVTFKKIGACERAGTDQRRRAARGLVRRSA
jgi:transposase